MYYCSQLLTADPLAGCCAGGTIRVIHNLFFVKSRDNSKPLHQRLWGTGSWGQRVGDWGSLHSLTPYSSPGLASLCGQGLFLREFHPKLASGKI